MLVNDFLIVNGKIYREREPTLRSLKKRQTGNNNSISLLFIMNSSKFFKDESFVWNVL